MSKIVLTFDFELGWGCLENGLWKIREKKGIYKRMSYVLDTLLTQMEVMEIPATWATVGGMLQNISDMDLDYLPDNYKDMVFSALRSADKQTFNGHTLFEKICNSKVKHVIACHSHTHIRFNHEHINENTIRSDLKQFFSVIPDTIQRPDRFVFPQNIEAFYDILEEAGFKKVRGNELNDYNGSRMSYLLSTLTRPPPMSQSIKVGDNLFRETGSMFFNTGYNRLYRLPFLLLRARRGLSDVVKTGGTFHLWCHPFNFSESPRLLDSFIYILKSAARIRDAGYLEITTF